MMKLYILHYASMDSAGEMNIDCKVFKSLETAQIEQNLIIHEFLGKNNLINKHFIQEEHLSFKRIACTNELTELQSHIEEFEQ